PKPSGEISRGSRRELLRRPARHRVHRILDIPRLYPCSQTGEEIGHVESRDFSGDVLLREHAIADHDAHALGHELPVRGNERSVGNRQAKGVAEEGGHGKPVRQAPYDARFRHGQDPAPPPRRAEREGRDGESDSSEEGGEGKTPPRRARPAHEGRMTRGGRRHPATARTSGAVPSCRASPRSSCREPPGSALGWARPTWKLCPCPRSPAREP